MHALWHTIRTALRALWRNKMRSGLTTLGIVIGIGAVIAMVEFGEGSRKSIEAIIRNMGANNLMIQAGQAASGGVSFGSGSANSLTPEDYLAIRNECSTVAAVAPTVRARTQVIFGNKNWVPLFIYGTTHDYIEVREWRVVEGRNLTPQESVGLSSVCLIGQTVARELFGSQSPINQVVRINSTPVRVVGLLSRKGANMMGMDQDDVVLLPWRAVKLRISGETAEAANQSATAKADPSKQVNRASARYITEQPLLYPEKSASQLVNHPSNQTPMFVERIYVRVKSENDIPLAISQITNLLNERHRIRPGQPSDFNIRDMAELSRAGKSQSEVMGILLPAVALISLVVGGVGIMNIMLVSVTERTKEIGLRMAVGARPRDILRQFLVEAVMLCMIGGIAGIFFGWTGSWFMRAVLNWPTETSVPAVITTVGVSVVVGVAFGFFPAWKASRLNPIEALRYE